MKLITVLSLLAYGYADKLDRTYLPPPSAGSAGGSPGSLVAPGQESNFSQLAPGSRGSQLQPRPLGQQAPGSRGSLPQPGPHGQQSGFPQVSGAPDFAQSRPSAAPGFSQPAELGNGSKGPSVGFAPYVQSGDQTTPQVPNFAPPLVSGVQPSTDNFDPSLFEEPGFRGPSQIKNVFNGQSVQRQGAPASSEAKADIFRYENHIDGGSYSYDFETSNGIFVEESGVASDGVQAHGEYAYTGDDGQFYKITYTADQNGYLPQGDHLPTSPPIPQEILRSIEKNAMAAAAGTQEGAYNPDDDASLVFNGAYVPGQILLGGSNGFGASGKTQTPFFRNSNQGSNQGPNQSAFKAQGGNQQGPRQGANGSQSQGQVGYDYSRPQNQGNQPSGNANFTPTSSTKTPGSQNLSRSFQGQSQPSSSGVFGHSRSNQGQYQNPLQKQQAGSHGLVLTGSKYNRGSQGVTQRMQQAGKPVPILRFGSPGSQKIPMFGQTRPIQTQNHPQQGSQGQIGSQASQGQRGQGVQNQSGYEYNKPQPSFNSGNQGPFRPSSQGLTGLSSQGTFPSTQIQNGFPESTGSRPGSVQGPIPGSNGTTRPQSSKGQQQGIPGSGPQSPKPSFVLFDPEAERSTSLKPKIPLNQTTQTQDVFVGPLQQASFSFEEGYRY